MSYWVDTDRAIAKKILRLIGETLKTPFEGTGKPEPLRGDLRGCWSRRSTKEHRLVYRVTDQEVVFLQARFHY